MGTGMRRKDGSASMGWHADPDLLKRDAFSADFGIGFYGHWKNAGAPVHTHVAARALREKGEALTGR